jgi:hypothetical protein
MCADQADELRVAAFDTQAVIAFQTLFTVDDLTSIFFKKEHLLKRVSSRVAEAVKRKVVDVSTARIFVDTIKQLYAPHSAFDANAEVAQAKTVGERVERQLLWIGRQARNIARDRLGRAAIELSETRHVDAVRETLTHELVHAAAPNFVAEFPDGTDTRSGYRVPSKKLGEPSKFRSLNEACTETIAQRALGRTAANDAFVEPGSYENDRLLLGAIVNVIAERNGETDSSRRMHWAASSWRGSAAEARMVAGAMKPSRSMVNWSVTASGGRMLPSFARQRCTRFQ